jgi:Ras-related protein Rab-1A
MSPTYLLKVVAVGHPAVGKTSIILRYTTGSFREHYIPTLGVDFAIKKVELDSHMVRLQVWDMGSQEFLGSVRSGFYPGARGSVFMFDVSRRDSFEAIQNWKAEVDAHLSKYVGILVANKIDLISEREVTTEEGKQLAEKMGMDYIETSVKLNQNVNEAFRVIAKKIIEYIE